MTRSNKLPLAHAYLEEFLERTDSPDCACADFVHTILAMAHLTALDVPGARAELDLAAKSPRSPPSSRGASSSSRTVRSASPCSGERSPRRSGSPRGT